MSFLERVAKRISSEVGITAVMVAKDSVLLDGNLTEKDLEKLAEIIHAEKPNPDRSLGDKGVRDPDFPCKGYDPSPRELADHEAECETDGHFLCLECKYRKPDSVEFEAENENRSLG
jgi:hypothetical protein